MIWISLVGGFSVLNELTQLGCASVEHVRIQCFTISNDASDDVL
jgi:hypothetical protein